MGSPSTDPLDRLEALLALDDPRARHRRMLMVVNPYATTVSDRLRNLVVYALRGRYDVRPVDTEARGHATRICRQAAREGFDAVVVLGGDGTVNEAANGLLGSRTTLCCLPGGRTNVYCRMLGIPTDLVDATEQLLGLADRWHPRLVDVGIVNGRCFLFSAGVGLDANVVEQVDAHPRLKARLGEWYYAWTGVRTFARRYLAAPPGLRATLPGERVDGVTVIVQNATPYTYFGMRPVQIGEGATLQSGDLAGVVLRRAGPLEIPTVMWRMLSRGARLADHPQVHPFSGQTELQVRSLDERPLPIQVDGDYIGEAGEARFQVRAEGILVLA